MTAVETQPVILHEGRYRLYQKPDGTIRVQYRRDDSDEDDSLEIPGFILRMAEAMSEGKISPLKALSAMRSGKFE